MSKAQDNERRAAECLLLAKQAKDGTNRTLLLQMAQTWRDLAERENARDRAPPRQPPDP